MYMYVVLVLRVHNCMYIYIYMYIYVLLLSRVHVCVNVYALVEKLHVAIYMYNYSS